jgi:hypothetical protein
VSKVRWLGRYSKHGGILLTRAELSSFEQGESNEQAG